MDELQKYTLLMLLSLLAIAVIIVVGNVYSH